MWRALDQWLCDDEAPEALVALAPAWSRRDFVAQVLALGERLAGAGVRAVALHVEDAARFACALLACAHRGITVCLPPNLGEANLAWADDSADLWLCDRAGLAVRKPLWPTDDDRPGDGLPAAVDAGLAAGSSSPPLTPCHPDRRLDVGTRLLLKTSGSTGQPRVVEKTLAQFVAEAEALADAWSLRSMSPVDAAIGSVSPQHLYGLSFRVVLSLCAGWPIHRGQCAYPESLLEAALRHPRSVWITSPVLLGSLGEDRVADVLHGRVVRLVSSGGSLPAAIGQRLQRQLGIVPSEIYGSTETGVIAWRAGPGTWQVLHPACWGAGEQGALWIESAWSGGRQQTGDVVLPQGEGFVLQGRLDRIIKLADKRVSLSQLEQELLQHAWVADAHCSLLPQGRRLLAWLALSAEGLTMLREQGRQAVVQGLRQHLLRTQDAVAVPRAWRFDTRLPRNSQGKLGHDDIRQVSTRRLTAPVWQAVTAAGADVLASDSTDVDAGAAASAGAGAGSGAGAVAGEAGLPTSDMTLVSEGARRTASAAPSQTGAGTAEAAASGERHPLVFEAEVPLDLVHFGGHFARFPLVPGVVEIDWIMGLARRHLDCPPHLVRGEALKFRQFVRPGDRVRATLDWRADQHKLSFSLESGQGVCASGRLLFADRRDKP